MLVVCFVSASALVRQIHLESKANERTDAQCVDGNEQFAFDRVKCAQ